MGLFDSLQETMTSPLFLGGLGLATGGMQGLQGGMQTGMAYGAQRKKDEQDRLFKEASQAALSDPRFANLGAGEKQLLASSPQLLTHALGTAYAHQFDPMAPLKMRQAEEDLKLSPLKRALLSAQASQANAHAGYYAANSKNPIFDPAAAEAERRRKFLEENYTRDEDGNLQRRDPTVRNEVRGAVTPPMPPQTEIRRLGSGTEDQAAFGELIPRDVPQSKVERGAAKAADNTLTDDDIQAYYDMKFPGARGKGTIWRRDGTLQKLETTQSERQSHMMAQDALTELRMARDRLSKTGTIDQAMGAEYDLGLFGKRRPFENFTKGSESAGIAFRGVSASMNDLLFALSGKQVTDKEREHYHDLYMPRSTDTKDIQQWKMDRMERFFARVIAARRTGATDDDIAQMLRREVGAKPGDTGSPSPKREAPSAVTPASGGWSIKRLD